MTNYIKYEVKVYTSGDKCWYLNGKPHREDGPALEFSEDGPALEFSDGRKAWYLNGLRLTEEEFNKRMSPTVEMTMAQINEALGKKVKVVD